MTDPGFVVKVRPPQSKYRFAVRPVARQPLRARRAARLRAARRPGRRIMTRIAPRCSLRSPCCGSPEKEARRAADTAVSARPEKKRGFLNRTQALGAWE